MSYSTHRQAARELISDPSPAADRTRLLSFNRTQSGVAANFLTGHNALSRHPYTMGLINSSVCRRKPQLTICVSVKIWRHSDTSIWVRFSWTLRMLKSHSGAIYNIKGQGCHDLDSSVRDIKGLPKTIYVGTERVRTHYPFHSNRLVPISVTQTGSAAPLFVFCDAATHHHPHAVRHACTECR